MMNKLLYIDDQIQLAIDDIRNAINEADDILTDCDNQWRDVAELKRKLGLILSWLTVIYPKPVLCAVLSAKEEYDHLSDLEDAQSY